MKYLLTLIALISILFSKTPPISFIALKNDTWKIIVCKENLQSCQSIQTEQEPRTYDYDFDTKKLVYVASDKSVRIVKNQKEKEIIKSDKDAYTEPSFQKDTSLIILVQLINGNSKKTKVITMDLNGSKVETLISQYSTVLEPYMIDARQIYYANVSCVEGCGKIIQEIWHKDIVTGIANQLTLLNTLSHQPRIDKENKFIYFSSAKKGNYHIWRYNLYDSTVKQLTFGDVTDGFPTPYEAGVLFLRRIDNTIKLMNLSKEGKTKELIFSKSYKKIRNLKVKQ